MWQSGFTDSDRRMQCDQKPMLRQKRLDFAGDIRTSERKAVASRDRESMLPAGSRNHTPFSKAEEKSLELALLSGS
jgi:hypothetical protein